MVLALLTQRNDPRLPVYLTRFFGRVSELDQLTQLLDDPTERVITLVGPGGVGKTRLLVEALKRVDPGQMLFVDGIGVDRAERLLPEIVDLLGIDRSAGGLVGELLSEHLAGTQLMLLIDNMEHLLSAAADLAALLRALPGLRLVTTSRAPLHISGEYLLPVEPLTTSSNREHMDGPSVEAQIFLDRGSRSGKLGTLTEADLATVETICTRLDGLPLAIELAAARLRVLSLPALLAVLTNQLSVLTGGPIDVSERHRTLRAAIGWSYDLLDSDEQRMVRELGIFFESFTLEAVDEICSSGSRATIDVIESLYDQALLMRTEDDPAGLPRYRMLSSIHDYAVEQLQASGDEPLLRERHATSFLQLAEQLEPELTSPGQQLAVDRLNRSMPNLRQALEFLIDRGDQEAALRMATALSRYWLIRTQWEESKQIFAAIFAMGESKATRVWGYGLRAAAIVAETTYDNETALDLNRRAIAIWDELGDRTGLAQSQIDLGNVYSNLGRFDEAVAAFEKARELSDPIAEPRTTIVARGSIGVAYLRKGAVQEADRIFFDLLPELRTFGDPWMLSTSLSNAAVARQRLGDHATSRKLLAESLVLRERLGDEYGVAATLLNLCEVLDDPEESVRESRRILEIALRIGAQDVASAARTNLGEAALARGDQAAASANYIEALGGYTAINDELAQADLIGLIAELGIELHPETAVRLLGAVRAEQDRHGVYPVGPAADRIASIQKRLRQAQGETTFERDLEAGRQLTLAEARIDALVLARACSTQKTPSPARQTEPHTAHLTARELEVLRLITLGNTDKQIAEALFITPKTANHHVTRILAKLECRNRAAATALAFKRGLVESSSTR